SLGVVPEPRPLPSTGVTRLHRYYGPLRLPTRPGLSLAGCRLRVTHPHRVGSPVLRGSPALTCRRHYPGGTVRSFSRSVQCGPDLGLRSSRRRPSRPLCPVGFRVSAFGACSAFTRVTACRLAGPLNGPVHRRLRRCSYLHRRSDCYRLERPLLRG